MDFDYCQGNSTIVLSFERETGKWSGWKGLAGICEFSETDCVPSIPVPYPPIPEGDTEVAWMERVGENSGVDSGCANL
jgi:hypothetical protein